MSRATSLTTRRPKIVDDLELALGELHGTASPRTIRCIGRTLAECAFRAKAGVTVIAILREPEPISGAQPDDVVQHGDTLARPASTRRFRRLLTGAEPI